MLKTILKPIKLSGQKVVAVAFGRWSFTRGSDYRDMTGKSACVLPDTGGHIWEVIAHVGSTVLTTTIDQQRFIKKPTNKNVMSVKRRSETACMITACTDLQRK